VYEHMSNVKVLVIYMYSKKQAGKPCKRANVLCKISNNLVTPGIITKIVTFIEPHIIFVN
jgi:hypothetical protein